MRILGEVEGRVRGKGRKERVDKRKKKIDKKELREMIKRLKDRKAVGADEIPSEVWKYKGKEIMKWVLEFCNKTWKGKGWPREWKERILVSLLKKE